MTPPLHLGHEFLLLTLDDDRGTKSLSTTRFSFGYAGSIVAHWMFTGELVSTKANRFRLRPHDASWPSLQAAASCLPDEDLGLNHILGKLYGWNPHNRFTPALEELVGLDLLRERADRFFGIRWRTRWPTVDGRTENLLVERLRTHVTSYGAGPPHRDDALVGLLRATKQLDSVWTDDELPAVRPAIVQCSERVTLGREVKKAFEDYETAVATTVVT